MWGYRTLMLGWAAYALFIVLATWWVASLRTLARRPGAAAGPGPRRGRLGPRFRHVGRAAGAEGGLLARTVSITKSVSGPPRRSPLPAGRAPRWPCGGGGKAGHLPPALGSQFRGVAGRVVLPSRRRQFAEWWLGCVEANVIASAAVALVWLAAQRRLYQLRHSAWAIPRSSPRKSHCPPPARSPCWRCRWSGWSARRRTCRPGWPTVRRAGLARAAAGRCGRRVVSWPGLAGQPDPRPRRSLLGDRRAGGLPRRPVQRRPRTGDWLAYHTLLTAWASAALLVLGIAVRSGC